MRKSIIFAIILLSLFGGLAHSKKVLDHSSFDDWKNVVNYGLSQNGEWEFYAVNPQEGDGVLTFYNSKTGKKVEIERGYKPQVTSDGKWGVALIKPYFTDTRKAKIAKKKDFDLPQDSLAIINLTNLKVEKIASVIGYEVGKDGGNWIAYQSCDTTYIKPKALKDKKAGKPLIVRFLSTGLQKVVKWVDNYSFDEKGTKLTMRMKKCKGDTIATDGIAMISFPDTSLLIIDRDKPFYGVPVFDRTGSRLAYTASTDTIETGTKQAKLYLADVGGKLRMPVEMPASVSVKSEKGEETYFANQYSKPKFSYNSKRLLIGLAPVVAPDDTTIVDFERADLDIWRWDSPMTPPQELKQVKEMREATYPFVINLATNQGQMISSTYLEQVEVPDRWDGNWALIIDRNNTLRSHQWDYFTDAYMTLVNVETGERREIGKANNEEIRLSASDKYVIWYNDRHYYSYEIATGNVRNISADVPYPTWDEEEDKPMPPMPYGIAAWSKDDEAVMIYDRYDIWRLDPKGEKKPECLTKGYGRANGETFLLIKTDPEQRYLSTGDEMLLSVFNHKDKCNGLAVMRYGAPQNPSVKVLDTYKYTQVRKAKKADVYSWQRANFNTSPDIWISRGVNFASARQLSDANPQMKDYNWGTAQLVDWYTYRGKPSQGVLYVPEDMDPNKKYPMLVVFYERNSEELFRHYTMEPSWSWVNYPFYVSRGYVVFVPDIRYSTGIPGESCYDYVCSGVESLLEKYPWIDKDRIGIDGQSWGGYQTAYLITRTNMFACAGSGAPVANMTSAYGGIRWESGDSRQAQYEMGQSRIGRTLWESPQLYIANSPVFYADRVETPLLIMHNDADGAVPWYQGIEMFMALRRLEKPVWMLQYNGEAHNIRARKNRKDITIRLQQFFDHYLKGDPMPKWMKEGIPAIRKGQEMNYE